ncbi:MAG TPA: hypothetical protein DG754_14525 [Bacteroidales bacterium]|nr:hypothetical protein [Bacteroidales bacterium]
MFSGSSNSTFFSSNVKVYTSLLVIYFLSWLFSFKPTIGLMKEAGKQEDEIFELMKLENESKQYEKSYPFVSNKKTLSSRDEVLLRTLDEHRTDFDFRIVSIEPFTYTSRAGVMHITTRVTLEGAYTSIIKIIDEIQIKPEIGKVSSVKVYATEDRLTKSKTLFCTLIIQTMAEQ